MATELKINEIFHSIQGEGLDQGLPTVFVRLTGCNLRCSYCDSKYSYDEGVYRPVDEIIAQIKSFGCKRVCITGGEPLLQSGCLDLVKGLRGHSVSIETNGSLDVRSYLNHATISLDIKCPSSGCSKQMKLDNLRHLTKKDQVKFIAADAADLKFAFDIISRYRLLDTTNVLINPVFGADYQKIVKILLESGLDARFGMQIHKFIWDPQKRGV